MGWPRPNDDDNRPKTVADFKRLPARKTMMSSFIIEGNEFNAAPRGVETIRGDLGRAVLIHRARSRMTNPPRQTQRSCASV